MKKMGIIQLILILFIACSGPESGSGEATVETLLQTTLSWNGNELPAYPDGLPEISILKVSIPPHSELGMHKHPVINAGVLVKGELTVITTDQDTLHMKSGDALSEVVDTWHYGVNEGDETAEIIVFYAGEVGEPLSVHAE